MSEPTYEEALAFLEHHGVKGMKWGTRRARRIGQIERVGGGGGSRTDKVKVGLMEVSPTSARKHGGLAGAAANKAANMRVRDERMAKGEAKVTDILARHGGDRLIDTGRVDKSRQLAAKQKKSDQDLAELLRLERSSR